MTIYAPVVTPTEYSLKISSHSQEPKDLWVLLSFHLQKQLKIYRVTLALSLNPLSDGIQIHVVLMGGGIRCLPLKPWKIKLHSHVRGQNRGF